MSAYVKFWGTRGSIPTPGHSTKRYGGNTSCVEIRMAGLLFICDGGTGLRELGLALSERGPVEAHMFFSHMHWDHIQGFPFFTPAYTKQNRIHVHEVTPFDNRVHRLLHGQMRSEYFPVEFTDLRASISGRHFENNELHVGDVRVRCLEQVHPGRSFAYSFECDGKKVVYATDSELDLSIRNREETDRDPSLLRQLPPELVDFIGGADLLIGDAQYTDLEYPARVGWGHPRANTVVDLAVQAGVKQCALFHHDPMQHDQAVDEKVQTGRDRAVAHASQLGVFGAREGLELKL
ncbi:MAG TPA: MBL fold metallo-hydrolase [Polyangiaceae bacterium]|nr:MBL fold metallo-hydrolase [Polyangiaceae bacterium]